MVKVRASVSVRGWNDSRMVAEERNGSPATSEAAERRSAPRYLVADVDVVVVIRQRERALVAGRAVQVHERDDLARLDLLRQQQQQPHGALGDRVRALVAEDVRAAERGDVDR